LSIRLLLLGLLFFPSLSQAQFWSARDYEKYDLNAFLKLEAVHQEINFEAVNRPLLQAAMFYATNEQRIKYGLQPFRFLNQLEKVAAGHADDMVNYHFYSHVSRLKQKRTIVDRFKMEGLNLAAISENISLSSGLQYQYGRKVNAPGSTGQFTYATSRREIITPHTYMTYAREVVGLWMNSATHRKSILNPTFKFLGCGSALFKDQNSYNMPYFKGVQCFGSGE